MLNLNHLYPQKSTFIFELDQVLIPEKEYDLQVYYLFTNFIEYLETFPNANEMLEFISKRYELHGKQNMFNELVSVFGIDKKYEENLALLFSNAKLPLKILLYKEALELLEDLVANRKNIYILTAGNPQTQLNKITQTEWNGLDQYLKVYFVDEYEQKPSAKALEILINENNIDRDKVVLFGLNQTDKQMATNFGITLENLLINKDI
jgi:phosphoglycolate phosphatase-like HAD superfamily hydrolase